MKEPKRPDSVPADAVWNKDEKEWQRGPRSKKRGTYPVGRWEYWRSNGTLCCVANLDDEGRLDGMLERFHDDGTLAFCGPYKDGHQHGHFVHLQSKNETSERYPANENTWRYEFDSNANWEEHNIRFFLEDGRECTSTGKPLAEAYDLDQIISKMGPDNFLELQAETAKQAIGPNPFAEGDESEEIDLSQLEELWGISPEPLKKFISALHETDSFSVRKTQRKFPVEDNVWYNLIAHPWENCHEELSAIFLGAIQIGRFGDSDAVYTTILRHLFEKPEPNYVYEWSHETYYIDDLITLNQDDFAFRTAISAAHEMERLSPRATKAAWAKLSGRTLARWAACSGLSLITDGEDDSDGDAGNDDDLDEENDEEVRKEDFDTDLDSEHKKRSVFWRSQWISYLLVADSRRKMSDVLETFRPVYNKSISDAKHKEMMNRGIKIPSNACYFLWRYFWFKQEDRLQDCCELFRNSPVRILRDLVKLIDDISAGKTAIGKDIKDILAVREEFLKLDLCPENESEREAKSAINSEADSKKVQTVREQAEKAYKKGPDALLELAWTYANDPLVIDEIEQFARKYPGNDLSWKSFDWVCNSGHVRAEQSQKSEIAGLASRLGQSQDCYILQPFIWARLFKRDYFTAHSMLTGMATNPDGLDPRLEKVLVAQLDEIEEYNHKRELAVALLGAMQAYNTMPRLLMIIDDFFKEMEKYSRYEVREHTFPWEALLLEIAKTLGKFANSQSENRTIVCEKLKKLFSFATQNYQYKHAAAILQTLCAFGETGLLGSIYCLLHGVDDPERWAALRTLECIASQLNQDELEELSGLRNPVDHDNAITVLYFRALHALAAADSTGKLFKPEKMSKVMNLAEELSNYGDESWKEYRIVKCETVGKFQELDLSLIEPYLYASDRELREAAESAYRQRGAKIPARNVLSWADVWAVLDAEDDRHRATEKLAELIANPSSVDRSAVAGWLWENPSAAGAKQLATLVTRELGQYTPPGHGENLSVELVWILRALVKHANYPEIAPLIERCFKMDDKEISGAVLQEVEALPVSFAPLLVSIAADDDGWRRYYIARWAAKHQSDELVSKALKSAKITEKKLAAWAK